jgi:hypothetical protein
MTALIAEYVARCVSVEVVLYVGSVVVEPLEMTSVSRYERRSPIGSPRVGQELLLGEELAGVAQEPAQ